MNANKLFSEFSLQRIWEKILKHDKAMNSTLLILPSGNWTEQADGTFKNIVFYATFKDIDKLTVDLYDDGTLTDTILTEYEQYIDSFEIINGGLVAIANVKPTQTMTVVVKGDFEVNKVEITTIDCVNNFESTETNVPASGNLVRLLKEDVDKVRDECFQFGSDRKSEIITALSFSDLGLTQESSWEDITEALRILYPEQLYLYNKGDECTNVTSGWNAYPYKDSTSSSGAVTPSVTRGSNYIQISTDNLHAGSLFTEKSIDLTSYKSLIFNGQRTSSKGGENCYIVVTATKQNNYSAKKMLFIENTAKDYIIDISDLTGKYYIALTVAGSNTKTMRMNSMKLM